MAKSFISITGYSADYKKHITYAEMIVDANLDYSHKIQTGDLLAQITERYVSCETPLVVAIVKPLNYPDKQDLLVRSILSDDAIKTERRTVTRR